MRLKHIIEYTVRRNEKLNAEPQQIQIFKKTAVLAVLDYGASFLCAIKKSIKYFRF